MVTTGLNFFTRQSNGQLLIFDMRIKRRCDNENIAQGISGTRYKLTKVYFAL